MTLQNTTVSVFPYHADVLVNNRFSVAWMQALNLLYSRIGGPEAPSNSEIANQIALGVTGPNSSVDGDIALFDGNSGKVIKDSGVQHQAVVSETELLGLANYASPAVDQRILQRISDLEAWQTPLSDPQLPRRVADIEAQLVERYTPVAPVVQAFVAPTLINSWANFTTSGPWNPAGYFKDPWGIVHLRGMMDTSVGAIGTVIFVLPVGYRPANKEVLATSSNGTAGSIIVDTSGNVTANSGVAGAWITLDNLTFRAV